MFLEREPRALPWAIICRAFSPFESAVISVHQRLGQMADVFTKSKRSEVMSRIRGRLRQPVRRGGETASDESGAQHVRFR